MIELSAKQTEFLSREDPPVLFCGGVGSGKTAAGAIWTRHRAFYFPKSLGFVGANTYLQLHKSTLPVLFKILDEHGPGYVYNRRPPINWKHPSRFKDHDNVITLANGKQILTYSLDNYKVIRGIELSEFWIDETRDSKEEAFNQLLERLRGPGDVPFQGRITTTPNGFDWLWRKFVSESRLKRTSWVHATSYDNPFLGEAYAANLEGDLGPKLAEQEIYAKFVSLAEGRAFDFERERNVRDNIGLDTRSPLVFTMDYNVSPLCALVLQIHRDSRRASVCDEIYIPDEGKTREACREFARRFKDWKGAVEIDGDIAGKHRDTRSTHDDHAIMKQEIAKHFKNVRWAGDGRQRFVFDGVQAVNALLNPTKGEPRLLIDKKCSYLIRDLEQVAWKPGTRELDKSNGQLTHLADALRYPIARLFPVSSSGRVVTGWSEVDQPQKRKGFLGSIRRAANATR